MSLVEVHFCIRCPGKLVKHTMKYVSYVKSKSGLAVVNFDGYKSGSNTKDSTHTRLKSTVYWTVSFTPDMKLQTEESDFLSNDVHKQIHRSLRIPPWTGKLWSPSRRGWCWLPRCNNHAASCTNTRHRLCWVWHRSDCACDTTSKLFGFGKATTLSIIQNDKCFCEQATFFNRSGSSASEAEKKGLMCLYNDKHVDNLNAFKYRKFQELLRTSKTDVPPKSSPPTSATVKYHSLRTYHQVQACMERC